MSSPSNSTPSSPDDLRTVVRWAIERYLPAEQLKILKAAEASEREIIAKLVDGLAGEIAP